MDGATDIVSNNKAHSLIDSKRAKLDKGHKEIKPAVDKMIKSKGKKKIKGWKTK